MGLSKFSERHLNVKKSHAEVKEALVVKNSALVANLVAPSDQETSSVIEK